MRTVKGLRWHCIACHKTGHLIPRYAWLRETCRLGDCSLATLANANLESERGSARAIMPRIADLTEKELGSYMTLSLMTPCVTCAVEGR